MNDKNGSLGPEMALQWNLPYPGGLVLGVPVTQICPFLGI